MHPQTIRDLSESGGIRLLLDIPSEGIRSRRHIGVEADVAAPEICCTLRFRESKTVGTGMTDAGALEAATRRPENSRRGGGFSVASRASDVHIDERSDMMVSRIGGVASASRIWTVTLLRSTASRQHTSVLRR